METTVEMKRPMPSILLVVAGLVPALVVGLTGGLFTDAIAFAFVGTLALVHAAPHWGAAAIVLGRRTRTATIIASLAVLAQVALMAWAVASLDDDAQAGLLFVFATPIASAAIAVVATGVILLRR